MFLFLFFYSQWILIVHQSREVVFNRAEFFRVKAAAHENSKI